MKPIGSFIDAKNGGFTSMVSQRFSPKTQPGYSLSGGFGSKAPRVRSAFAAACELGDLEDGHSGLGFHGFHGLPRLFTEKSEPRGQNEAHMSKLSQGNHSKDPASKNIM
jgi:hypothetical protein